MFDAGHTVAMLLITMATNGHIIHSTSDAPNYLTLSTMQRFLCDRLYSYQNLRKLTTTANVSHSAAATSNSEQHIRTHNN